MKMEQTECSETLAFKLQTSGNNPEESIRHTNINLAVPDSLRVNWRTDGHGVANKHNFAIFHCKRGKMCRLYVCYILICLLTYLLTLWSRVLLEKLTGSQLIKKFSAFYGTRRFITKFTSARHLSLSWASSIQSIPPHATSWRSILLRSHQSISPDPRLCLWIFRTKIRFHGEELLAPNPTPKLEDHPLSVVRNCLFSIFVATPHIGGQSSIRNQGTRHPVVTGTQSLHKSFVEVLYRSPLKSVKIRDIRLPP
jgi:hypothetical protein